MELTQADLPYFAAFVLLDEAWRFPSGKRAKDPMKGFWLSGQIRPGMRLSDRRLRNNICIEAFHRVGGRSISLAAAEVAAYQVGQQKAPDVEVLRVGYYESRCGQLNWDFFFGQFLLWRDWVLNLTNEALDSLLENYQRSHGEPRRRRFAECIKRLRADSVQRTRQQSWLREVAQLAKDRIESNRWNSQRDWQMLATDCWQAGRLQAQFGEIGEAKHFLVRALEIWQVHGHELPYLQLRAIAGLKHQIARLESAS